MFRKHLYRGAILGIRCSTVVDFGLTSNNQKKREEKGYGCIVEKKKRDTVYLVLLLTLD